MDLFIINVRPQVRSDVKCVGMSCHAPRGFLPHDHVDVHDAPSRGEVSGVSRLGKIPFAATRGFMH